MRRSTLILSGFLLGGILALPGAALAGGDWQLSHGGFVTASDVRPHNGLAGDRVNAALYEALAAGQEHLLRQVWAEAEADTVERLLDEGALRLFLDALTLMAKHEDADARRVAALHARGVWLAAAEPVLDHAPAAVAAIERALTDPEGANDLAGAIDEVEKVLAHVTG